MLDFGNSSAQLPLTYKVKVLTDAVIPPHSRCLIKCKLQSDMALSGFTICTIHKFPRKCVTGSRIIITHVLDNVLALYIHNEDNETMFLQANDNVGAVRFLEADVMQFTDEQDVTTVIDGCTLVANAVTTGVVGKGHINHVSGVRTEYGKCSEVYYIDFMPKLDSIPENIVVQPAFVCHVSERQPCMTHYAIHDNIPMTDKDWKSLASFNRSDNAQAICNIVPRTQSCIATDYSNVHSTAQYPNEGELLYNQDHILFLPWEVGLLNNNLPQEELSRRYDIISNMVNEMPSNRLQGLNPKDVIDTLYKWHDTICYDNNMTGVIRGFRAKFNLKPHKIWSKKMYTLNPFLKDVLDDHIQLLMNKGIVEMSNSPYNCAIYLIPKSTGNGLSPAELTVKNTRVISDLRPLNLHLILPKHPIPSIDQILLNLARKSEKTEDLVFVSIDLQDGYFQLLLDDSSKKYTSFQTHSGKWQMRACPQGCAASPSIFCLVLSKILEGMSGILIWYLDDILLFGPRAKILQLLDTLLNRFAMYGLMLKLAKLRFFEKEVPFVGFFLSVNELGQLMIKPLPSKTDAIQNIRQPQSRRDTKSFLASILYYRRFLRRFSDLARPLYDLTRESHAPFSWNDRAQAAFLALKDELKQSVGLYMASFDVKFHLWTDSSMNSLSSVLTQFRQTANGEEMEVPISFDSKVLKQSQLSLTICIKELKAVCFGLRNYERYLRYVHFYLHCDSRAAIGLIQSQNVDNVPPKVIRMLAYIHSFKFDLLYTSSSTNRSDYWSRLAAAQEGKPMSSAEESSESNEIGQGSINAVMTHQELRMAYVAGVLDSKRDYFEVDNLQGNEIDSLFKEEDSPVIDSTVAVVTRSMSKNQARQQTSLESVKENDLEPENDCNASISDTVSKPEKLIVPTAVDDSWGDIKQLVSNYFPVTQSKDITHKTTRTSDHGKQPKPPLYDISEDESKRVLQYLRDSNDTLNRWVTAQRTDNEWTDLITFLETGCYKKAEKINSYGWPFCISGR